MQCHASCHATAGPPVLCMDITLRTRNHPPGPRQWAAACNKGSAVYPAGTTTVIQGPCAAKSCMSRPASHCVHMAVHLHSCRQPRACSACGQHPCAHSCTGAPPGTVVAQPHVCCGCWQSLATLQVWSAVTCCLPLTSCKACHLLCTYRQGPPSFQAATGLLCLWCVHALHVMCIALRLGRSGCSRCWCGAQRLAGLGHFQRSAWHATWRKKCCAAPDTSTASAQVHTSCRSLFC